MTVKLEIRVDPLGFPDQAEVARVISSSLKIWVAYFRRRVDNRFKEQGPGWAPRKASDDAIAAAREEKVKTLSEHRLKQKLVRDLVRARKRLDRGKGSDKAVERRYAVLKEFERQVAGGLQQLPASASKEDKRLAKSVAGLRQRKERAELQASERILGRISASIKSKTARGSADVFSSIDWAGVQNEGGVVGKGAQLPPRPFMYLTHQDVDVLVEIVNNRLAAVFGAT